MSTSSPVALITGAGGGIGRALTKRLHDLGYRLALNGRSLEKLKRSAEAAGCGETALLLPGDLTDRGFAEGLIAKVEAHFGRLDVLINNAGVCAIGPMQETSYETLDLLMKTNVYAPFILCRDAIPLLERSDCAEVINIGSVVSHKGYAMQSAYATAKHALLGMSKVLGAEVYSKGIRVHVIAPGGVNTDMVRISRPDIQTASMISPEDIADSVEFLLTHRGNAIIDEIQLHRYDKMPFA